jgi:hypothetical protein
VTHPQGGQPVAFFYPSGHPTPYAHLSLQKVDFEFAKEKKLGFKCFMGLNRREAKILKYGPKQIEKSEISGRKITEKT